MTINGLSSLIFYVRQNNTLYVKIWCCKVIYCISFTVFNSKSHSFWTPLKNRLKILKCPPLENELGYPQFLLQIPVNNSICGVIGKTSESFYHKFSSELFFDIFLQFWVKLPLFTPPRHFLCDNLVIGKLYAASLVCVSIEKYNNNAFGEGDYGV